MSIRYRELLKDPRWQKKRLEALEAAGWGCNNCGDQTSTLHVHHKRYVTGRMPWEYQLDELVVLCEGCHEGEHVHRELLNRLLADVGVGGLEIVIGVAGGYLAATEGVDERLAGEIRDAAPYYFEVGWSASVSKKQQG